MNKKLIILEVVFAITVIFIIYTLYIEYKYNNEISDSIIYNAEDFRKNKENNKYDNSALYKSYLELDRNDKIFFHDYINYINIQNKEIKPKFNKKLDTVKKNIILISIISFLISTKADITFSSVLKQNLFANAAGILL